MLTTIINAKINGKFYTVSETFNMVLNYEFTDENGVTYLVDGEDVAQWVEDGAGVAPNGIHSAIAYADHYASETEDGVFWWKVK